MLSQFLELNSEVQVRLGIPGIVFELLLPQLEIQALLGLHPVFTAHFAKVMNNNGQVGKLESFRETRRINDLVNSPLKT